MSAGFISDISCGFRFRVSIIGEIGWGLIDWQALPDLSGSAFHM